MGDGRIRQQGNSGVGARGRRQQDNRQRRRPDLRGRTYEEQMELLRPGRGPLSAEDYDPRRGRDSGYADEWDARPLTKEQSDAMSASYANWFLDNFMVPRPEKFSAIYFAIGGDYRRLPLLHKSQARSGELAQLAARVAASSRGARTLAGYAVPIGSALVAVARVVFGDVTGIFQLLAAAKGIYGAASDDGPQASGWLCWHLRRMALIQQWNRATGDKYTQHHLEQFQGTLPLR